MQLEPIIKKDTPLQVIVVYELGEDQLIELPNISVYDSWAYEMIKCEILQLAEWWNKDDTFITNKYNIHINDICNRRNRFIR